MEAVILEEFNNQIDNLEKALAIEKNEIMQIYLSGVLDYLVHNRRLIEGEV